MHVHRSVTFSLSIEIELHSGTIKNTVYSLYKSSTQLVEVITNIRLRHTFQKGAQKKGNVTDIVKLVKYITTKLDVGITCLAWSEELSWSPTVSGTFRFTKQIL